MLRPVMLLSRRLLLGAIGTLPLARLARGQVMHRLTILHMNDFHSRHRPVDARALTCSPGPSDCFGSSPRLATAIHEQRDAARNDGRQVLLLDGGDQFQGSLFYTAHHGMTELDVQHAIGTEAMTLGNHEFDNGPATLARYLEKARFPILSANIDAMQEPALAGRILPWVMLDKAGLKIAVIGLTTLETAISSSPGPGVRFTDPAAALARATAEAQAQGANLIVLLSHLGVAMDLQLAAPGVAVIVGGHSHTLLSNTEPGAAGPYPSLSPGRPLPLVVQAQAYGRFLGRLDLDLAADGTILAFAGACRHVGEDLVEDPAVAAIVAAYAAPLEALRQRPVATIPKAMEVASCKIAPCQLGSLVASAIRDAAHPPPNVAAVIGLMNAGGLRVGLPAGPVTLGQVLDMMPFGNTLATTTVTGAELAETVRHGLTMIGRGGYPQWAGLRIEGLAIQVEHDGTWSRIDPAARYLIATNNFVRAGGDGYTILRDQGQDPYDTGPGIADLIAGSLAASPSSSFGKGPDVTP